ncbi:hypothetical protein GCM10022406_22590 [Hymenobacter algoricola]|uniref:Uncharacterized protein n=1 Tax=Hymenobacter algoricola TaxID=486267 RepID=A0ABP7N6B5_9BACT
MLLGLLAPAGLGAGVGEKQPFGARPLSAAKAGTAARGGPPGSYLLPSRRVPYPDTARRPVAVPDTVKTRPAAVALEPDDDKLTRKSTIYIVAAMAALTLTTLLLYNVRSR